jgi:transposase-like protein
VAQHQRQLLQDSPEFLTQTGALADVTVMTSPDFKTVTPSKEDREEIITQALESGQALTDVAKRYGYHAVRVAMNVKGLTPTGAVAVEASMLPEASLKRVAKQAHEHASKDSSQRWFHQSVMLGGKVWVQVHGLSPSRPLTSHEIDARVRVSLGQQKAVQKTVKQAQEFQKQWQKASGKAKDKLATTMQQRITPALSHGARDAKDSPWDRLPGLLWQVLQSPDQTMQILPVHNGCWVAVVQRVETVVPTNAKGSSINTHELEQNTHDQWGKQAQNQWMQRVLSLASTKTDPELWAAWLQKMRHVPEGDEADFDLEDMD